MPNIYEWEAWGKVEATSHEEASQMIDALSSETVVVKDITISEDTEETLNG